MAAQAGSFKYVFWPSTFVMVIDLNSRPCCHDALSNLKLVATFYLNWFQSYKGQRSAKTSNLANFEYSRQFEIPGRHIWFILLALACPFRKYMVPLLSQLWRFFVGVHRNNPTCIYIIYKQLKFTIFLHVLFAHTHTRLFIELKIIMIVLLIFAETI